MSVYVDPIIDFWTPSMPVCFKAGSCHMYADTLSELHVFAVRVGLRRSWFQTSRTLNHYDLTVGRRAVAVRLGAIEQSDRLTIMNTWRRIMGRPPWSPIKLALEDNS